MFVLRHRLSAITKAAASSCTGARTLSTTHAPRSELPPTARAPGSLFVWGSNSSSQLGEPAISKNSPTPFPLTTAQLPSAVRSVACGTTHTLIASDDGHVYSWGSNDYGALGLREGGSLGSADGNAVAKSDIPALVDVLVGQDIVSVSAGPYHSAAVSAEGDVYTWGWGGSFLSGWGGLGHGDKTQQDLPGLVERLGEDGHIVRSVSCGAKHTLALSDEGVVLAWGDGEFGRLGNGRGSAPYPEVVEELANEKCKQVSAGEAFSMALSHDGSKVWVWGRNDQSQLGLGANLTMDLNSMEEYPIQCPVPSESPIAFISAGRQHALAVNEDGEAFFWGARQYIQPELLQVLKGVRVVKASAGDDCSALLSDAGELYTFGKRRQGVLGQGSVTSKKQPTLVSYFHDNNVQLADVRLGANHAVAITGKP